MDLQTLFQRSAGEHHGHLCPRQVLGVRMGLYAADLLAVAVPTTNKRLFAFVETDGCLVDGITAATDCAVGHRTMQIMDYGKTAATFVDTETERALRVLPARESRERSYAYAPDAPDRWHAQLAAYQIMPTTELLQAYPVALTVSLKALISHHGDRVVCAACGEDIINERFVEKGGQKFCRACAGAAYYQVLSPADAPAFFYVPASLGRTP